MGRKSHYAEHRLKVLGLIEAAARAHDRPPSVRELAETTGVGLATMHSYLTRLAEEDLIAWQPAHHRSLHCTPSGISLAAQVHAQA